MRRFALALLASSALVTPANALTIDPPVSTLTINGHTYTNQDWEANPQAVISAIAADIVAIAGAIGTSGVNTNAALKALTAGQYSSMVRLGYYAKGDGGYALYTWDGASSCSDDGGSCVAPNSGSGRWILSPTPKVDARVFGAQCDGSTNDAYSLITLSNYLTTLKGPVGYIPQTGFTCKFGTGLGLGNGGRFAGAGTKGFPGSNATCAQRAAAGGSWIESTDAVNPAVILAGHGSAFEGINICQTQPIPSDTAGVAWTPTAWPDSIRIVGSYTTVRDVECAGCTTAVNLLYTAGSGGGTQVVLDNIVGDGFDSFIKTNYVNDRLKLSNIYGRKIYYAGNPNVQKYTEDNSYCVKWGYTDNPIGDGIGCFNDRGWLFTDQTVTAGITATHSLYNGQFTNIELNNNKIGMAVASSSTTVDFRYSSILAQQDDSTLSGTRASPSDTFFQLASDNVNITGGHLEGRAFGGRIMDIGNGTSGVFGANSAKILRYSNVTAAQVGFNMAAGSSILKGMWDITKLGNSPGYVFGGVGSNTGVIGPSVSWTIWPTGAVTSGTCNGSVQTISSATAVDPGSIKATRVRIAGQLTVTTNAAGAAGQTWPSNYSEGAATGINFQTGATPHIETFDSAWKDIAIDGSGNFQYGGFGNQVMQCANTAAYDIGNTTMQAQ